MNELIKVKEMWGLKGSELASSDRNLHVYKNLKKKFKKKRK